MVDYGWTPAEAGTYTVRLAMFETNWSKAIFWNDSAMTITVAEADSQTEE